MYLTGDVPLPRTVYQVAHALERKCTHPRFFVSRILIGLIERHLVMGKEQR